MSERTGAPESNAVRLRPILNLDELETGDSRVHGDRFERRLAHVGKRIGARKLGYNVTRVAPGKRASPFHNHHVDEEMFFILEGTGTLRFGAEKFAVRSGDFVACPPGNASVAHQFINDGDGDPVYVAVSTQGDTDIWSYPDSGKFGLIGGERVRVDGPPEASFPAQYFRDGTAVDYWDGE